MPKLLQQIEYRQCACIFTYLGRYSSQSLSHLSDNSQNKFKSINKQNVAREIFPNRRSLNDWTSSGGGII